MFTDSTSLGSSFGSRPARRPRVSDGAGGGLNGSLTPARPRRAPTTHLAHNHNITPTPLRYSISAATPGIDRGLQSWRGREGNGWAEGSVSGLFKGVRQDNNLSGNSGGISLRDTEERISQLERAEFDLKMRLFYTEERLEEAAGGVDNVQLHQEIAQCKLERTRAEESLGATTQAEAALEAECEALQAQVEEAEARRKAEEEERAAAEAANLVRIKKHVRLLEDALKAERAENTRLRLTSADRRDSGASLTEFLEEEGHARRFASRRKSTGNACLAESGGVPARPGREQREQNLSLEVKVRSQDSTMRSLRADITTLRRRLRTQAEALTRQKDKTETVTRAAEELACVEAEEIARLAMELEQAVKEAKIERDKRHVAEERLIATQQRLLRRSANGHGTTNITTTTTATSSARRNVGNAAKRSQSPALRPSSSPGKLPTSNRRGAASTTNGGIFQRNFHDTSSVSHGSPAGASAQYAMTQEPAALNDKKRGRETISSGSRVTDSTISSRERVAQASELYVGRERRSTSPRGSRLRGGSQERSPTSPRGTSDTKAAAQEDSRPPWGSRSPPRKNVPNRDNQCSGSAVKARGNTGRLEDVGTVVTSNGKASVHEFSGSVGDGGDLTGDGRMASELIARRKENEAESGMKPSLCITVEKLPRRASIDTHVVQGLEKDDTIEGVDCPMTNVVEANKDAAALAALKSNGSTNGEAGKTTPKEFSGKHLEVADKRVDSIEVGREYGKCLQHKAGDHQEDKPREKPSSDQGVESKNGPSSDGKDSPVLDHDQTTVSSVVDEDETGDFCDLSLAAALRGSADLTATVARELRLAATTTSSSAKTNDVSTTAALAHGQLSPNEEMEAGGVLGCDESLRPSRDDDDGAEYDNTCKTIPRNGASKNTARCSRRSNDNVEVADGGRSVKSTELADVESEMHELFQLFAGRKGLGSDCRKGGAGVSGAAEGNCVEGAASAAIGHALAVWGSADASV